MPNDEETICSYYKSLPLYNRGFPPTTRSLLRKTNFKEFKRGFPNFWNACLSQIRSILRATQPNFIHKYPNTKCYQLFGVDFFINKSLQPKVLEINMGPGMDPKTDIDQQMRVQLMKDLSSTLGLNGVGFFSSNEFMEL